MKEESHYYIIQCLKKLNLIKFFGKYMLLFEGIKNRGIAFSPLIKKLVNIQDICPNWKNISHTLAQ